MNIKITIGKKLSRNKNVMNIINFILWVDSYTMITTVNLLYKSSYNVN